jgi:hypothetical protein
LTVPSDSSVDHRGTDGANADSVGLLADASSASPPETGATDIVAAATQDAGLDITSATADTGPDVPVQGPDSPSADTAIISNDARPDGAADGTGGMSGKGGTSGSSGAGGRGGALGAGGSTILDWNGSTGGSTNPCATVSQLPADAVPVCAFTSGRGDATGCEASPSSVVADSASFYFVLDYSQSIVRCPKGISYSHVFENDNAAGPLERGFSERGFSDILYGQTLSNDLIRFVCKTSTETSHWDFRFTCSTNGIQTIQPMLKDGNLYIDVPMASSDSGTTTYEGRLDGYSSAPDFAARSIVFHTLGADTQMTVWTSPVSYAADGKTLWFNDLNGQQILIRLDTNFEVIDIQR